MYHSLYDAKGFYNPSLYLGLSLELPKLYILPGDGKKWFTDAQYQVYLGLKVDYFISLGYVPEQLDDLLESFMVEPLTTDPEDDESNRQWDEYIR